MPVRDVSGKNKDVVSDVRCLLRRLRVVGPAVPMGVVASLLDLSRMQVWRLIQEGRLKTEPIQGAKFVCLQSALKYAEKQERRRAKKKADGENEKG